MYVATKKGFGLSTDGGNNFSTKLSGTIISLYVDRKYNIYAGTPNGLFISQNDGSSFVSKTAADGLNSNDIYKIFVGVNGAVYVGTGNGLSVTNPYLTNK